MNSFGNLNTNANENLNSNTNENTNGNEASTPAATSGMPQTGNENASGTASACVSTGEAAQALVKDGEAVYTAKCAGCHGQQGEGGANFPALANNPDVTAQDLTTAVQKLTDPNVHPLYEAALTAGFTCARSEAQRVRWKPLLGRLV